MFSSPVSMGKKSNSTIPMDSYLRVAQVFHWATKEHFTLWFTGKTDRHRRTETMLPRLVDRNNLVTKNYRRRLIYTVRRRKNDTNYEHGLACTECLVRFWRSGLNGTIIPEYKLKGFDVVPEWAILKNKGLLLFEFSTRDNFTRPANVKKKLSEYRKNIYHFEESFKCSKSIVLFVAAVSREYVKGAALEYIGDDPFLFTDYQTFLEVQLGEQLTAPIYFWGDGESNSLVHAK